MRARIGDDAPADPEVGSTAREHERSDRDRKLDATTSRVDPSERAAIHAAADGFQILDCLQHSRLGRAGDRRRRKRRAHEVVETDVGPEPAAHGTHEVCEPGVGFDREERRDIDRSELADASEIVARQVDDHQVLGPVLLARAQCRGVGGRAFDGSRLDRAPVDPQKQFGRRRHDRDPWQRLAEDAHARMGGRIEARKRGEERVGIGRGVEREPAGQVHLVALAGQEERVYSSDEHRVLGRRETRRTRAEVDRRRFDVL